MNQNLGASIVLAVGLIVASVLVGGIYESHTASENAAFIWRVNRFTGSMIVCSPVSKDPNIFSPAYFDVPPNKSD